MNWAAMHYAERIAEKSRHLFFRRCPLFLIVSIGKKIILMCIAFVDVRDVREEWDKAMTKIQNISHVSQPKRHKIFDDNQSKVALSSLGAGQEQPLSKSSHTGNRKDSSTSIARLAFIMGAGATFLACIDAPGICVPGKYAQIAASIILLPITVPLGLLGGLFVGSVLALKELL